VANDGVHPPSTTSGAVKLTKGTHKLTAGVFNAGGGVELQIDIEGPRLGRQDLAPLVTLKPEGNLKPTVKPADPKEDDEFPIQPELVAKGRERFASLGCASCHQLSFDKKPVASSLKASPLNKLRPEGGCLAKEPGKGVPHYSLNPSQRNALAAALKAPAPPAKPSHEEIVATA